MKKKWLIIYSSMALLSGCSDLFDYSNDKGPDRNNSGNERKGNQQRSWIERLLKEDPETPPKSHGHAH